jgi:hypothetical protein
MLAFGVSLLRLLCLAPRHRRARRYCALSSPPIAVAAVVVLVAPGIIMPCYVL